LAVVDAGAASHEHDHQHGQKETLQVRRIFALQNHERHDNLQRRQPVRLGCTLRNSLWLNKPKSKPKSWNFKKCVLTPK
jgi:hypothetical protein